MQVDVEFQFFTEHYQRKKIYEHMFATHDIDSENESKDSH